MQSPLSLSFISNTQVLRLYSYFWGCPCLKGHWRKESRVHLYGLSFVSCLLETCFYGMFYVPPLEVGWPPFQLISDRGYWHSTYQEKLRVFIIYIRHFWREQGVHMQVQVGLSETEVWAFIMTREWYWEKVSLLGLEICEFWIFQHLHRCRAKEKVTGGAKKLSEIKH